MKALLKNILTKLFIVFMAIQIVNVSIDGTDFQPLYAANDLGNFDYMNSMTEYVSEILLQHKDAFPEYQKSQPSKAQILKHISFKIIPVYEMTGLENDNPGQLNYIHPFNENQTYSCFREINPPPPKSVII